MNILFLPFHTTQEYNYANYIPEYSIHRIENWHKEMREQPANIDILPEGSNIRLNDYDIIFMKIDHLDKYLSGIDIKEFQGKIILVNEFEHYPTNAKQAKVKALLELTNNVVCFVPNKQLAEIWGLEDGEYIEMMSVPSNDFRLADWRGTIYKLLVVDSGLKMASGFSSRGYDTLAVVAADIIPYDVLGWGNDDLDNSIGWTSTVNELISYYRNYRVYCSCKTSTGLPFDNSTLEAAAIGMPIVLGRDSSYMNKYENLLFASADPIKLRKQIELYFKNDDAAQEASEKSRILVREYFSDDRFRETFRNTIEV